MTEKLIEIHVYHWGECQCASFLAPVTTWKEVAERHDAKYTIKKSLVIISDTQEDWTVDLFQCRDCGRYWAHEDVGSPFMTRSYDFFYWANIPPHETPEEWLYRQRMFSVLSKLEKNRDDDYHQLIAPHLRLG